jgi:hypothetical protein
MKSEITIRIKIILFLFISLLYISNATAIEPPKKGIVPPKDFEQLKQNISKSYGEGYYAQKMSLRKALRDRIASGEISEQSLVADTAYALALLGQYSNSTPKYSATDFQQKLFDEQLRELNFYK